MFTKEALEQAMTKLGNTNEAQKAYLLSVAEKTLPEREIYDKLSELGPKPEQKAFFPF